MDKALTPVSKEIAGSIPGGVKSWKDWKIKRQSLTEYELTSNGIFATIEVGTPGVYCDKCRGNTTAYLKKCIIA